MPTSPQEPKRSRRTLWLLVSLAVVLSVLYPLRQYGASKAELRALVRHEKQIEAQTRALLEQKKRLSSDAEVERIAREHLHMVRPGEVAFSITGATPEPTLKAEAPKKPKKAKTPWYKAFWRWVTGN